MYVVVPRAGAATEGENDGAAAVDDDAVPVTAGETGAAERDTGAVEDGLGTEYIPSVLAGGTDDVIAGDGNAGDGWLLADDAVG